MADGSRSFNFPAPQRSRLRPGEIVAGLFAGGGDDARDPAGTVAASGSQQGQVAARLHAMAQNVLSNGLSAPLRPVLTGATRFSEIGCTLSREQETGALQVAAFLVNYYGTGSNVPTLHAAHHERFRAHGRKQRQPATAAHLSRSQPRPGLRSNGGVGMTRDLSRAHVPVRAVPDLQCVRALSARYPYLQKGTLDLVCSPIQRINIPQGIHRPIRLIHSQFQRLITIDSIDDQVDVLKIGLGVSKRVPRGNQGRHGRPRRDSVTNGHSPLFADAFQFDLYGKTLCRAFPGKPVFPICARTQRLHECLDRKRSKDQCSSKHMVMPDDRRTSLLTYHPSSVRGFGPGVVIDSSSDTKVRHPCDPSEFRPDHLMISIPLNPHLTALLVYPRKMP